MTTTLFVQTALNYRGYPSAKYTTPFQGVGENGFDCSGFIVFLLRKINFPLPPTIRHCSEFFDHFGVLVHPGCTHAGDLVFFSRDGLRPTHVGIIVSPETYIHAPGNSGSKIEVCPLPRPEIIEVKHNKNRLYLSNPIGFKRLALPQGGRYQKILE